VDTYADGESKGLSRWYVQEFLSRRAADVESIQSSLELIRETKARLVDSTSRRNTLRRRMLGWRVDGDRIGRYGPSWDHRDDQG
jgi:hypothetical protein